MSEGNISAYTRGIPISLDTRTPQMNVHRAGVHLEVIGEEDPNNKLSPVCYVYRSYKDRDPDQLVDVGVNIRYFHEDPLPSTYIDFSQLKVGDQKPIVMINGSRDENIDIPHVHTALPPSEKVSLVGAGLLHVSELELLATYHNSTYQWIQGEGINGEDFIIIAAVSRGPQTQWGRAFLLRIPTFGQFLRNGRQVLTHIHEVSIPDPREDIQVPLMQILRYARTAATVRYDIESLGFSTRSFKDPEHAAYIEDLINNPPGDSLDGIPL